MAFAILQNLRNMWYQFLEGIKLAKQDFKHKPETRVQPYTDIFHVNWLAIAVEKLANLACTESTYEIKTDSTLAAEVERLCSDLEEKRFDVVEGILGGGDYYAFPAIDEQGRLYHSYLDASRVRITAMAGKDITDAYAVIDYYQPKDNGEIYFLQRRHTLENSGTLRIRYQVVTSSGKPAGNINYWSDLTGIEQTFAGANHIGFGRWKSPVSSRGLSTIYGVPLNFGCADIERQLADTMAQIEQEFTNGKSVIFTDPRNLVADEDSKKYRFADNIIPMRQMAGQAGSAIDIFSPVLRDSSYYTKLNNQLSTYEQQLGCSRGILTENEAMATGTATAVRRANADTMALLDKVHNAMDAGNEMTLRADCVFLNINPDLWEYTSDYFDPFSDPAEQWAILKDGIALGAVDVSRATKWIYPDMTDEQIAEEMARVQAAKAQSLEAAISQAMQQ